MKSSDNAAPMSPDFIRQALRQVRYPGFSRDIVSFGLVKDISWEPGLTTVQIEVQTADPQIPAQIFQDCHAILDPLPDIGHAKILIEVKAPPVAAASADLGKSSIPGVKRIIAIASGKGGVGKSTVAANLAVALAATGARVGLCDCDLYGPSMALMFGTTERPLANEQDEIIPILAHGIQLMSMAFFSGRSPKSSLNFSKADLFQINLATEITIALLTNRSNRKLMHFNFIILFLRST